MIDFFYREILFGISIIELVDLALILLLFYAIYRMLRGGVAVNMMFGLLMILAVSLVVKWMNLKLLSSFLRQLSQVGVIFFAIVFQPEIRRILLTIGRNSIFRRLKIFKRFFFENNPNAMKERRQVHEITEALDFMSKNNTGAIIVLQQTANLSQYADTGVKMYADLSAKLIESIFTKQSPLHDGAIIVEDYRIIAASCTLPVSESRELPERIGLRHKSAVGITEVSDAVVFIVSEQTGKISYVKDGKLKIDIPLAKVEVILNKIYYPVGK